jgi:hypothetical protein
LLVALVEMRAQPEVRAPEDRVEMGGVEHLQ